MKLIITHEQPDFDALASLALARRLHPDGRIVLPGALSPEIRSCVRLYRDRLDPLDADQAAGEAFDELVVVDTADGTRLGNFARHLGGVAITVYDHHPPASPDDALPAGRGLIDPVGATVTLMVRELRRREDGIPPELASLGLLGLHEDTGGFSFGLTTAEDHEAAAWLLRCGGTLDLVRRFARGHRSEEHQHFRSRMLHEAELVTVAGRPVAVASFAWPEYLADVAGMTNELLDLQSADAALLAVRMDARTLLFARAAGDGIDVGAALRESAGGGGHGGAAFARTEASLAAATEDALAAFAQHTRPPLRAADLMSRAVRTVGAEETVHDAARLLLRYGHNGLPVLDGERLVGVLSRRDVERALRHGLGRSKVQGFMGTPPVSAPPDATLESLEALVADRNVGRLPILERGRLVGIVTRSDLLGARHRRTRTDPGPVQRILARLPDRAARAVAVLREALPPEGRLYLVGGSVRDALLGTTIADLDLALENADASELASALTRDMGGEHTHHETFGTASARLPGGLAVDLAGAREERYARSGALPEVVPSDLRRDLARRDFTVNAMALRLAPAPPEIVDPFGGMSDLEQRRLRVLHPLSFMEDATRIVRGARLAARLGFAFEEVTAVRARAALDAGATDLVSAQRLRSELEATLREVRVAPALAELAALGALRRAYGLAHPHGVLTALDALREEGREVPAAAYLLAMLEPLGEEQRSGIIARFHWPKRRVAILGRLGELRQGAAPSDAALETLGRAGRAVLEAYGSPFRERVRTFESLAGEPRLRGQDVIELGLPPGPEVGRVLDEVAHARSERRVQGFDEELDLARDLVRRLGATTERRNDAT